MPENGSESELLKDTTSLATREIFEGNLSYLNMEIPLLKDTLGECVLEAK